MSGEAPISAVSRALQAIELLAASPRGLTVSVLAQTLGIELSIASRILSTLAADGYARRDTFGQYVLTYRLVATACRFVDGLGFVDLCIPLLQEVAHRTGELVQLALREGDNLWYVAKAEGKHRIRMLSAIGRAMPLHASAIGKAWLATLDEDEALKLAAARGLKLFAPQTITSLSQLQKELRRVRAQGYSVVVEEYMEGGSGVGAVIQPERTGVVGAVSLAAPTFRVTREDLAAFGIEVVQLAQRLASIWPLSGGSLMSALPVAPVDDDRPEPRPRRRNPRRK
jgi:IclR family transcriptional regulator, acetate operon repressor